MPAEIKGAPKPGTRALPPMPSPQGNGSTRAATHLPEVPGDGIIDFSTAATEPEQRSVLFRIDGREFTVWDNAPASVGLRYLDVIRRQGVNAAITWALEVMLGADALAALKACPSLPPAGLQRVVEVCVEKINATFGAEPPKTLD